MSEEVANVEILRHFQKAWRIIPQEHFKKLI